jgi:hypothetical protein
MLTASQNYALVQTELDRVFFQEFQYTDTTPSIATADTAALFKPMTIDRGAYIEEIYKGPALFSKIGEVATVPQFTPSASNKMTTRVQDFAQSVELSKDWFDDNLHNVWSRTVSELARMARVSQDDNAFALFRGAFTTSLTADGAAWISASHTLLNGQTLSNLITGALTPTTLNNAIVALRQQKNQAGVILGNAPAYLVVPPAMFVHATQITESALVADTANNNLNVYRSAYGITIFTSPYLSADAGGSDTAWFLLARNHTVTRIIRQGLQTFLRDWGYSNNRTYLYQANFREVVYTPDYIGAVASLGV